MAHVTSVISSLFGHYNTYQSSHRISLLIAFRSSHHFSILSSHGSSLHPSVFSSHQSSHRFSILSSLPDPLITWLQPSPFSHLTT
jgi:hypothetical protein